MKTVKEVSEITGISIRTLRYYDEIGLLKPTNLSESNYRLYDNKAIEKLQEIMFFKELEIPLSDIKTIMDDPNYDKEQILLAQKSILEKKRNHLNGIIELICDVVKGVNTMSFEAFNDDDIQKMLDHTLECMSKDALQEQIEKYGSEENYREYLSRGFSNEQAMADLMKWYGSKEKAMEVMLQSTGRKEEIKQDQEENNGIYRLFMAAKEKGDTQLAKVAVEQLADNYKKLFHLDNARNILTDLAKEYFAEDKLAQATDSQYGNGCARYVAEAIQDYYGIISK